MEAVLQTSMSFFEKVPYNLIMTRIGRDLQAIEQILSSEVSDLFTFAFATLGTIVIITLVTPYFIIAMVPVSLAFTFISIFYVNAVRELKVILFLYFILYYFILLIYYFILFIISLNKIYYCY